MKRWLKLLFSVALLVGLSRTYAEEVRWLSLESGGMRIFKLYGLPHGERLTVTLSPLVALDEGNAFNWFYQAIDSDLPRIGEVVNEYQMELMKIPGLSVMTTMRRCRDRFRSRHLVHYQAFYFTHQQRMWFARTELNDNMELLIRYYGDQLGLIMDTIGVQMNLRPS
jgi:hypothetical protein